MDIRKFKALSKVLPAHGCLRRCNDKAMGLTEESWFDSRQKENIVFPSAITGPAMACTDPIRPETGISS